MCWLFLKGDLMKDNFYMKKALIQAQQAYDNDEVPVGAIIVYQDQVIASAYNTNHQDQNALMHAEIKVINEACNYLKSKNLSDCTLYVSLEPCMMCLGAIKNSRISRVVFAAFDLEYGSIISNQFYKDDKSINWVSGILKEEASQLLKDYFIYKRKD